jgi:hypothetical protein
MDEAASHNYIDVIEIKEKQKIMKRDELMRS